MHVMRLRRGYRCFFPSLAFLLVFSATAFAFAFLHKNESVKPQTESKQMNVYHFMKLVHSANGPVRVLERINLEGGDALKVEDIITRDPESSRAVVMRVIATANVKEGGHTVARLSLPEDLTECNIDTSKWSIDKSYLHPGTYYHLAAEAVFYASGIRLTRGSDARVLMVGLGGGLINSFLHHNFPKMRVTVVELSAVMVYLASKWFSLKLDDRHLLVVADGVNFLEQQEKNGVTYDSVIIDACYSNIGHDQMCPIDAFLEEKIIHAMSKVVNKRGILVMNSVPVVQNVAEEGKFLRARFERFFKYCNIRDTGLGNGVFYCMHRRSRKENKIDLLKFIRSNRSPIFAM